MKILPLLVLLTLPLGSYAAMTSSDSSTRMLDNMRYCTELSVDYMRFGLLAQLSPDDGEAKFQAYVKQQSTQIQNPDDQRSVVDLGVIAWAYRKKADPAIVAMSLYDKCLKAQGTDI